MKQRIVFCVCFGWCGYPPCILHTHMHHIFRNVKPNRNCADKTRTRPRQPSALSACWRATGNSALNMRCVCVCVICVFTPSRHYHRDNDSTLIAERAFCARYIACAGTHTDTNTRARGRDKREPARASSSSSSATSSAAAAAAVVVSHSRRCSNNICAVSACACVLVALAEYMREH